jgi:hypothetical protein
MKLSKKSVFTIFALVASISSAMAPSLSHADDNVFWQDVRDLLLKCAVQPYAVNANGRRVYGPLKSRCSEVQVTDAGARFSLNGETYVAQLKESEQSDGGDLFDVTVLDSKGQVFAVRNCALAFGDVLLGLAGRDEGFDEEYDVQVLAQF